MDLTYIRHGEMRKFSWRTSTGDATWVTWTQTGDYIILEWIQRNFGVKVWTGFNWLRIGSNGRILRALLSIFGFHKR
jgi:hypothetical protein